MSKEAWAGLMVLLGVCFAIALIYSRTPVDLLNN